MSSFRRGAWALIVFAGIGCDHKKETAAAPSPAAMPPLDQPGGAAAPGTSSRPTHEPTTPGNEGSGALPAGHPPIGAGESGSAAAPGFEGATPVVEFDPKTVLAGVIKLDPKLKDKVQAGDTIFLVARRF